MLAYKTSVDMTSAQTIPASETDQNQTVGVAEDILKQFVPPQLFPTTHRLQLGDARKMSALKPESLHLVLTSPPYWTLKEYRDSEGQMGHIEDYDQFLQELDKVWKQCFHVLVPGGRLICVVGDVCLSRRENGGRHTVVPL